mgnify:CR=1 FL=1
MNAVRLMTTLEAQLRPVFALHKGITSIAAEPQEALELLGKQAPERWGVCLVWQGYGGTPDADLPEAQTNKLSVFVRVPIGLMLEPGDAIWKATPGGAASVLELVEFVCLAVRRIKFSNEDVDSRGFLLTKSDWWRKEEGKTLRIHELQFELVTILDAAADDVNVTIL